MAKGGGRGGGLEIRLSGGEFGGRRLKTAGPLRPTPAIVREALFDILRDQIEGARFLDAFAGSGAVGLEALGRGAATATFLESASSSLRVLRENVDVLGVKERTAIIPGDALAHLASPTLPFGPFDIAFLDPPYDLGLCARGLEKLALGAFPNPENPDSVAVIQASRREAVPESAGGLRLVQTRRYGDSTLYFYSASNA